MISLFLKKGLDNYWDTVVYYCLGIDVIKYERS